MSARAGSRLALVCALWLVAASASAQTLSLRAARGPYYVGSPIELRVTAEGFEEDPQPEIEAPKLASGELTLTGVSPNVSSSISIVNGRVSRTKDVSFVYSYRFVPRRTGSLTLAPFRVRQGETLLETQAARFDVQTIASSDLVRVALVLPESAAYVGERIPIRLEFWLENSLQKDLQEYVLQVPLFDLTDRFRLIDQPDPKATTEVSVSTAEGTRTLKGRVTRSSVNGREYLVVGVDRTLVPLRAGSHTIPAASVIASQGTGWRRDILGGRRATQVRKLRAADRVRTLEVRAIPSVGMPRAFAGAVGSGFTLDVAADRSVVQVGEPITLTLHLRGEGNLANAALPPLDAPGLLPATQFRVPEGELPGTLDGGVKTFSAVVRVLDESVAEIPALEYAWFDPSTETYATTRSRPIALSVRSSEVIGAGEVYSDATAGARQAPASADGAAGSEAATRPRARTFALTGADLAIERDADLLLRDTRRGALSPWGRAGLYAGSLALVGLAWLQRRRASADPRIARQRALLDAEVAQLREAAGLPANQAASRIAAALRRLLAELPEAQTAELDALLGECDSHAYAPPGTEVPEAARTALQQRALEWAERIRERAR